MSIKEHYKEHSDRRSGSGILCSLKTVCCTCTSCPFLPSFSVFVNAKPLVVVLYVILKSQLCQDTLSRKSVIKAGDFVLN